MSDSTPGLVQSLVALGAALAINSARRAAVTLLGYLASALLLATSVVFLTLAGYRAISQSIGDVYAALVMGAVYLLLALIALLVLGRRRG